MKQINLEMKFNSSEEKELTQKFLRRVKEKYGLHEYLVFKWYFRLMNYGSRNDYFHVSCRAIIRYMDIFNIKTFPELCRKMYAIKLPTVACLQLGETDIMNLQRKDHKIGMIPIHYLVQLNTREIYKGFVKINDFSHKRNLNLS